MHLSSEENIVLTVLIILCSLLLSLNCLVGKFVTEEASFRNSGSYTRDINTYSFYCEDLSLSPDDDYVTFNVKQQEFKYFLYRNRYVCQYWNLTAVLTKFVERKSRLRLALGLDGLRYSQCGNDSLKEASGYLCATFTQVSRHQKYHGNGTDLLIHWDNHGETSFISALIHYHKGLIRVPESRFYFLYASILINISKTINQFQNKRASRFGFLLRICVNRYGFGQTLLHKSQSYTSADESAVASLSVAGHVFLAKGESVYVRVSEASRIVRKSVGNTFGLMPLK